MYQNLLNKLQSDIRLCVFFWILVFLQSFYEILDLSGVLRGWSTELGAVLTNKPLKS